MVTIHKPSEETIAVIGAVVIFYILLVIMLLALFAPMETIIFVLEYAAPINFGITSTASVYHVYVKVRKLRKLAKQDRQ